MSEYHGIIVSLSQRDRSIFKRLEIVGRKRVLFGLVTLYKVRVRHEALEAVIRELQGNMARGVLFRRMEFYAHFYREHELVIVFREKTFAVSPDPATWTGALAFGRTLGIP
ncbi:MAG: hypothetical protein JXA20_09685, partial [Spirochaetes bacterium]|nr:hypothetical protein [Spirochaetota bacterium]